MEPVPARHEQVSDDVVDECNDCPAAQSTAGFK